MWLLHKQGEYMFKPEIVKFRNGKFGIRKYSWLGNDYGFFGGYVYLDKTSSYWWPNSHKWVERYSQFDDLESTQKRLEEFKKTPIMVKVPKDSGEPVKFSKGRLVG
jgi:hypothetical protein